jgi:CO dehydrogenase/acetyl-CoA synthase beta subunit
MVDPDPSNFDHFSVGGEDLSDVQDVQGPGFNAQGLEDVEDSPLVVKESVQEEEEEEEEEEKEEQEDQDDVQHVLVPHLLLFKEGSDF